MASGFVPSAVFEAELVAELHPVLEELGGQIAEGTAARAKDPDYADSVEVVDDGDGVYVRTLYSFAHLDEWGSSNNPPTAAMRTSAAEAGRFVPS